MIRRYERGEGLASNRRATRGPPVLFPRMKLKTLAVTAAIALAAVTATAAPASANPCAAHLDTILGGICIPTP